ncbi:hypothetical protein M067_3551 [Bacteroides fragilis str. J-143-4]|nr:hypothetical protein M067_3551 [Bacteroides fragilis str. J-143-4]
MVSYPFWAKAGPLYLLANSAQFLFWSAGNVVTFWMKRAENAGYISAAVMK